MFLHNHVLKNWACANNGISDGTSKLIFIVNLRKVIKMLQDFVTNNLSNSASQKSWGLLGEQELVMKTKSRLPIQSYITGVIELRRHF